MNLIAPTINDEKLIEIVSQYIDLKVIPYGQATRTQIKIDTRNPMYGGNGIVYLLQMFDVNELVNNRIGAYMVFLNKDDQAGFHTHGPRNEEELYIVVQGEGEYSEKKGEDGAVRKQKISKGNITAMSGDGFHSVNNTTDDPLIIFVITTNKPKSE